MSQAWLDRKQACEAYTGAYPDDEWDTDIHHIVSDYNFDDHWLFGAISALAGKLKDDDENADLRRRMYFLVDLLGLPFPPHWDDDNWDEETEL